MTNIKEDSQQFQTAVQDFQRARQRAAMRRLMARLTGKSLELLSYEQIQAHLPASGEVDRGVIEIPLDAIVGSVGRYEDFTRDFLPLKDANQERWARVKTAVTSMKGWPPIEVYQVGDVFFVIDGNHRVSVARQIGSETITAHVTEIKTKVPLSPDDDPDAVIAKVQYGDFLADTGLDQLRPACDLLMTITGYYDLLRYQIDWRQRQLELEAGAPATRETAVISWYDHIYLPVVALIREQGVLRRFPRRTEADIYALLSEHRAELEADLGWQIDTRTAVTDLAEEQSAGKRPWRWLRQRVRRAFIPEELADGPPPGKWRQKQLAEGRRQRLFTDYLVAMHDADTDWQMLEQVIGMARHENDRLLGLHVVPHERYVTAEPAQALKARFEARCREAGLHGEMAIEVGEVAQTIIERAAWVDLVVTQLRNPPDDQPLSRLSSGFVKLVQRCPRPLLAIPSGAPLSLERVLLAYDGSSKAEEALFVATYLTSRWPIALTVLTVETEHTPPQTLDVARSYIENHGIGDARYLLRQKPIADAVLETVESTGSTLLIMGGFGFRPVLHLVLGSTVERVLNELKHPVLICR